MKREKKLLVMSHLGPLLVGHVIVVYDQRSPGHADMRIHKVHNSSMLCS